MRYTQDDFDNVRKFLNSPLVEEFLHRMRETYIFEFRRNEDVNERTKIAAKLDAADDLLRSMQGVLDSFEVDDVSSE